MEKHAPPAEPPAEPIRTRDAFSWNREARPAEPTPSEDRALSMAEFWARVDAGA